MEEGGLTQEEIDALLVVDDDLLEEESHSLDDSERDKATGIFQKAITAGCETLATMVGQDIKPEHLTVEATTAQSIIDRFDESFGCVLCSLDVNGNSYGHLMAFPMSEAVHMANQMMGGGDEGAGELSEMGQSAFESLMETFNGTLANTLAAETKQKNWCWWPQIPQWLNGRDGSRVKQNRRGRQNHTGSVRPCGAWSGDCPCPEPGCNCRREADD